MRKQILVLAESSLGDSAPWGACIHERTAIAKTGKNGLILYLLYNF